MNQRAYLYNVLYWPGRVNVDISKYEAIKKFNAQRASAGLIISEATGISSQGLGWTYAPGLWSEEQTAAWKPVTQAVHSNGGLIIAQLWHMGRMAHSAVTGERPVSSSATTMRGKRIHMVAKSRLKSPARSQQVSFAGLIADYVRAARNAMEAGFDGIQIHAANGQLMDQFLRNTSNTRTDEYGGSVENRIRLLEQVTRAVADTIGSGSDVCTPLSKWRKLWCRRQQPRTAVRGGGRYAERNRDRVPGTARTRPRRNIRLDGCAAPPCR